MNEQPDRTSAQPRLIGPAEGDELALPGTRILLKVTQHDTEARYALVQATNRPGWASELNRHPHHSKVFFILEGSYEFVCDGRWGTAGPGDTLLVPAGCVHGFRAGPGGGRVLIVYPGESAGWFTEVAAAGGLDQLSSTAHTHLHARHNVESLGALPQRP